MSRSLPGPAHLVTVARPRAHAIEPENLGTRIWPARTVRVRRPGPPGQLAGSQPGRPGAGVSVTSHSAGSCK